MGCGECWYDDQNLLDYTALETRLSGFDACFFCLGVTSAGMTEADYERVTYGITFAAAQTLSRLNPSMTFFVSGAGADSSEQVGRFTERCSTPSWWRRARFSS